MANLSKHPAPGFGELIPGWFVEPENPIMNAQKMGLSDLVPGKFSTPENPILAATLRGCGCGCESAGMGDLDLASIANTEVFGFPLWGVVGAGLLLMTMMGGRGSGYREEKARIRKKHPTTAGRIKRAAQAF